VGQAIVSLRLDPDTGTFTPGKAVQLSLFGATRRGDTSLIPANMALWSSSSPEIAPITRQGRLSPARAGRVTITARHGGQTASAQYLVLAAPETDG
jgi:hypothetical protein